MSSKHGMWAWKAETDNNAQRDVLLFFALRWDSEPIQAKVSDITAEVRWERKTVIKALKELSAKGYLQRVEVKGSVKGDIYTLNVSQLRGSTRATNGIGQDPPTRATNGIGKTSYPPMPKTEGVPNSTHATNGTGSANGTGMPRELEGGRGEAFKDSLVIENTRVIENIESLGHERKDTGITAIRASEPAKSLSENQPENPAYPLVTQDDSSSLNSVNSHYQKPPLKMTPVHPDAPTIQTANKWLAVLLDSARSVGKVGEGQVYFVERNFLLAVPQAEKLWKCSYEEACERIVGQWTTYLLKQTPRFQAKLDNWFKSDTWKEDSNLWGQYDGRNKGSRAGAGVAARRERAPLTGAVADAIRNVNRRQRELAEQEARDSEGVPTPAQPLGAARRLQPPGTVPRRAGSSVVPLARQGLLSGGKKL